LKYLKRIGIGGGRGWARYRKERGFGFPTMGSGFEKNEFNLSLEEQRNIKQGFTVIVGRRWGKINRMMYRPYKGERGISRKVLKCISDDASGFWTHPSNLPKHKQYHPLKDSVGPKFITKKTGTGTRMGDFENIGRTEGVTYCNHDLL